MTRHRWSHGEHRRPFFDTRPGALVLGVLLGGSLVAALWSYLEARG